ncbi:hypothetical protein FA13DRAFT_1741127 [Coprinellus micaceus]|uniref:Uncharacterized protein n=1 Tax=Coprinellus micaceus TaxID=71717 RepID=A0A4Y7SKB9_COPMI|nr:hypothetical protein FA13DRAFT_1741120 [Coprinellus micaceus]TEB22333.1 hypothetical protein FA13DRAFT_1741127 [Coprinellus micaceus]
MRLVVTPYGHPTRHVTSPGGVSTPNTHPLVSRPYAQRPPRMSRLDAERAPRVSRPYAHPLVPRSYAERPPPDAMSHPLHHVPTANAHPLTPRPIPSRHVRPAHTTSLSPTPTPSRDTTTNTHAHAPCHVL